MILSPSKADRTAQAGKRSRPCPMTATRRWMSRPRRMCHFNTFSPYKDGVRLPTSVHGGAIENGRARNPLTQCSVPVLVPVWLHILGDPQCSAEERYHMFSILLASDPLPLSTWSPKHRQYLDGELELVVEFGDEEVVRQTFAHLHDSDDGRVHLVLAVVEDSLRRRRVLLLLNMQKTTWLSLHASRWRSLLTGGRYKRHAGFTQDFKHQIPWHALTKTCFSRQIYNTLQPFHLTETVPTLT